MKNILCIGKIIPFAKKQIIEADYTPLSLDLLLSENGYPKTFLTYCTKKDLFRALNKLSLHNIFGVFTLFEHSLIAQSWAQEYYGLNFCEDRALKQALDKYLMRAAFLECAPEITPQAFVVKSLPDLQKKSCLIKYPIMLKPSGLTKSLLIRKNNTPEELDRNYQFLTKHIGQTYKKEGAHKKPIILIEEFLEGSFHSLCAAVDCHGKISPLPPVDLVMASEKNWVDNHNYRRVLPSQLSKENTLLANRMVQKAVSALGLRNTLTHTEFVLTKSGPKIIEIGARIGGYRTEMYKRVYSYDVTLAHISLGKGICPLFKDKNPLGYSAVYEIFPRKNGVVHSVRGLRFIKIIPGVVNVKQNIFAGEKTGLAKDGFRSVAIIKIFCKQKQQFFDLQKIIESRVFVTLKR
jgi:hypothetical protein